MFACNSGNDERKESSVRPKASFKISLESAQSTTAHPQAENTLLQCAVDAVLVDDIMQHKEIYPIDSAILDQTVDILNSPDDADTDESTEQYPNIHKEQEPILFQHDYQNITKMSNTLQGELFKAKLKSDDSFVIIKKTNKELYSEGIGVDHRTHFSFCVDEDTRKEAFILRYLTENKTIKYAAYIRKFIETFETKTDYYLVMEHIEDGMTFKEFVEKAHEFMKAKKMDFKYYVNIIRYLFWQIFVTMRWLHVDMKC